MDAVEDRETQIEGDAVERLRAVEWLELGFGVQGTSRAHETWSRRPIPRETRRSSMLGSGEW